jgi:hypothetical protein
MSAGSAAVVADYEGVKKYSIFNIQFSIVICGCAFARHIKEIIARSATADEN